MFDLPHRVILNMCIMYSNFNSYVYFCTQKRLKQVHVFVTVIFSIYISYKSNFVNYPEVNPCLIKRILHQHKQNNHRHLFHSKNIWGHIFFE